MLKPLGNSVVVRRSEADKTTPGGLVIPATAQDQSTVFRGEVLAVGRGRVTDAGKLVEPELRAGDRVLIGRARGFEVDHEGQKLLVVNADDVIAIEG